MHYQNDDSLLIETIHNEYNDKQLAKKKDENLIFKLIENITKKEDVQNLSELVSFDTEVNEVNEVNNNVLDLPKRFIIDNENVNIIDKNDIKPKNGKIRKISKTAELEIKRNQKDRQKREKQEQIEKIKQAKQAEKKEKKEKKERQKLIKVLNVGEKKGKKDKYIRKNVIRNDNYILQTYEESHAPSPLRISTITSTGCVGCFINLSLFYHNVIIDDINDHSIKRDGLTYIEWSKPCEENDTKSTLCRGFHKKMLIHQKTKQEGKRFDKQITVILRKYNSDEDSYLYQNLKIFSNGNIQMTGLKDPEQGIWVLDYIISILKDMKKTENSIYFNTSVFGENALKVHDYSIRMINSDFKLGYAINRRVLDNCMDRYGLYHIFEAGQYPGVKISFYWNEKKTIQNGVCDCKNKKCIKKCSSSEDRCQKITIIVFQSGSVIITGSRSIQQVNDTYEFIMNVLKEINSEIQKTIVHPQLIKKYPKFSYNDTSVKEVRRLPKGYIIDELFNDKDKTIKTKDMNENEKNEEKEEKEEKEENK